MGTGSTDQGEMVGRLVSRVASLENALAASRCAQRLMHNELVELRGNVCPPTCECQLLSCPLIVMAALICNSTFTG